MKFNDLTKEDAELLSYKDLTSLILEEQGKKNTLELLKLIVGKLNLSASHLDDKIADYYTMLNNDKKFVLLEDGNWDLSDNYTSDLKKKNLDEEDDFDDEEISEDEENDETEIEEEIESKNNYDDSYQEDDFDDEGLDGLVVVDEDEMELE
jgi:DNA-directed RNA polymerase delta subunit